MRALAESKTIKQKFLKTILCIYSTSKRKIGNFTIRRDNSNKK